MLKYQKSTPTSKAWTRTSTKAFKIWSGRTNTLKINQEGITSRRNNIKIIGVPEEEDEETLDDTEAKVKTLLKEKLEIEDEVEIERAHWV